MNIQPGPWYGVGTIEGKVYTFMLPRKNASTTLRDVLARMGVTLEVVDASGIRGTRIGVVRHPVDRAISAWKHGTQYNDGRVFGHTEILPNMEWGAFVNVICSTRDEDLCQYTGTNAHWRSQYYELFVDGRLPDVLLRVESLSLDWATITRYLEWPDVQVKILNRSSISSSERPYVYSNGDKPITVIDHYEVEQEHLHKLDVRYANDAKMFDYDILNWRRT